MNLIEDLISGFNWGSRGRSARRDEDEEFTDETITKPTTKEIHKAIDTLVDFSMFT